VRRVSPGGTITTVAGDGTPPPWPRSTGDGGPATNSSVVPFGVAVDGAGNLFVSEGNYADVRKESLDGTISTVLSRNARLPYFGYIEAMTVDPMGNLYAAGSDCGNDDSCYNAVRKVSPSGDVTLIAYVGFASSLALDSAGNLFIADLLGERVRKIDLSGIITTIGGNGAAGYSGDGGPATNATMNYPFGLATDATGNVYVSEFNQAVRILRPSSQSK
jgi:sugar lactone lactonase YvrE